MLLDCVPHSEIRAALNISYGSFRNIYKKICDEMVENEIVDTGIQRKKRAAQYENAANKAAAAWEVSKESGVETITTYKTEKCPSCRGMKVNGDGDDCEKCCGKGG